MTKEMCEHREADILINGVCINCGTCDVNKLFCSAFEYFYKNADKVLVISAILYFSIQLFVWFLSGFPLTV